MDEEVATELGGLLAGKAARAEPLRAWLEKVLSRRQVLNEHIRWLQAGKDRLPARSVADPGEEALRALLERGVGAIGDDEVRRLLLLPGLLCLLHDRIEEELPEAWLEAISRLGEQLCRERGIELPEPQVPPAAANGSRSCTEGERPL